MLLDDSAGCRGERTHSGHHVGLCIGCARLDKAGATSWIAPAIVTVTPFQHTPYLDCENRRSVGFVGGSDDHAPTVGGTSEAQQAPRLGGVR